MEAYEALDNSLSSGKSPKETMKEAFDAQVTPYIISMERLQEKPPDFTQISECIAIKSHPDESAKRVLAFGMHQDINSLLMAGFDYWMPFPTPIDPPDECRRAFESFFAGKRGKGVQEKIAWESFKEAWARARKSFDK